MKDKESLQGIHKKLSELIADYESETGIAITNIYPRWIQFVGGAQILEKLEITSEDSPGAAE